MARRTYAKPNESDSLDELLDAIFEPCDDGVGWTDEQLLEMQIEAQGLLYI